MGEIHELFVLALSLVWFAGATPEGGGILRGIPWTLPFSYVRGGISEMPRLSYSIAGRPSSQNFVLPALVQKLVGEFFWVFVREIWREVWREVCGMFLTCKIKARKFRGAEARR